MSIDFATFDLTELAVLDASDTVAMAAVRATNTARFIDDMDDLIGKPDMEILGDMCCSCLTQAPCCCNQAA